MHDIIASVTEELGAIHSGKFVPYQKLAILVTVVISLIFSLTMTHTAAFEAPVAVIDLDRSATTAAWIGEIDSSPYIRVTRVEGTPVPPKTLIAHDAAVGVLYLPKGLERAMKLGDRRMTAGYFADDTNDAQNAHVSEELSLFFAERGSEFRAGRAGALRLGPEETAATLSPLTLVKRDLHNPVSSVTNGTTIAFIYFFSSIFYTLTVLMVVGRIRVTGLWKKTVLARSASAMASRAVPYAFIYTAAILAATAVLVNFGQLAFRGNVFAYAPSIFMTGLAFGWIAMIISWNTHNPGEGAGLMTYIVPPGFVFGGATMATGFMLPWAYWASHLFPLVWQYRFYRDFAARGEPAGGSLTLYGAYLIYLLILFSLIWLRFRKDKKDAAAVPGGKKAAAPESAPAP